MTQDARPERRKPDDLDACHQLIDELFEVIDAISGDRDAVVQDRDRVQQMYDELRRCMYGPRRERFENPAQLKLFDKTDGDSSEDEGSATVPESVEETAETSAPAAPARKKKRRSGRRRFPEHFPRLRKEHKLPDEQLPCACCGELRRIIGEVISERLDYVPGYYQVLQDVRFKYACPNEDCEKSVTTAPKPPQPIEKGAATASLLADVVVSKFTDHLPTYRKEEISDRHGWIIPRTTQCGWLRQTAGTATLLVALMMARVLQSRKIHTDDTPVKVIVPGEKQTKQGRFWVYCGDDPHPYTTYDFTMSRARDGPAAFLSGYEGHLQADAYGGYDGIAIESHGKLQLVGCGAHIRRKFHLQRQYAPEIACPTLARFRQLYLLERRWKPLPDEERYLLRQTHVLPILEELHQWLQSCSSRVLPKSKIGEAVSYALNQWPAWVRYCEAGYLSIDNNLSERMVKPCAMGRKAWLFLGSENGGATAAVLYSLTGSAKANRAHPFFYVRDVLDRIPEILHDSRVLGHLQAACEAAPLNDDQRLQLVGQQRLATCLDVLRCHPRVLADLFLQERIEADIVEALTALLPDRWLTAHPDHRLEINRPTGIPVGMERAFAD